MTNPTKKDSWEERYRELIGERWIEDLSFIKPFIASEIDRVKNEDNESAVRQIKRAREQGFSEGKVSVQGEDFEEGTVAGYNSAKMDYEDGWNDAIDKVLGVMPIARHKEVCGDFECPCLGEIEMREAVIESITKLRKK